MILSVCTPKHRYLAVLFLIGIGLELMAQTNQVEIGILTGDRVHVRGRPLPTAEICCQMSKGDSAQILERRLVQTVGTNTEEWVRIVLPEKVNVWLQTDLVKENVVIKNKVNGRAGPSLMWPVLCVFSKGDPVNVRTNQLEWIGVAPPPHASAWISGRYIRSETTPISIAQPVKSE